MKLYIKYFLCTLTIFLFSFVFHFTYAETDIYGGVISADTTWTKDASPYVIYAPADGGLPFSVDAGVTLTIEAGTIIKIDHDQSLNVSGKLITNGTTDEKVYFTSLYDDSVGGDTNLDEGLVEPYYNDWSGIKIIGGGNIELKNSDIFYAETGLYNDLATSLLDSVNIINCQNAISAYKSSVYIKNSNIKDIHGDGINIIDNSILNIENSNIENISGDALFLYSNSTSSIKYSTINNVSGDGFDINKNSNLNFENSSVNGVYGYILDMFGSNIANIINSKIENSSGGMEIFNDSALSINNSIITDVEARQFFELFNNSLLNITDSQIKNVAGDQFLEIFNGSYLNFSNSSLQNISGIAMEVFSSPWNDYGTTTLNISSSTISDGNKIGLQIFGSKTEANITKTKIQNFARDGIQAFSNPIIKITDSEISGNDNGIISWGSNVEIKNSIISGNKSYGISNDPADSGAPVIVAINNWWGDASGPFNADTNASGTANQVSENVEFSPWLINLPGTKPKCCSNVLFIPGLEASRLYKTDSEGNEKRLWEPEIFHNNSILYLDVNGKPKNSGIYTKDIIDNAYLPIKGNIYESFISSMNNLKIDGVINDWKSVPYDWRLSLDDLLNGGKEYSDGKIYYDGVLASTSNPYIISELRRLASSSATGKVTIIAHSNGGLITKELTNKLGEEASALIDQIIFVAVPQAGTPAAIGALLHGFQQGLPKDWLPLFISPYESRELGKNMSSAYNLLPFSQYFNYVSDPVITFDNSNLLSSWRTKYGNTINSGESLYNFLSDQSREKLPTKSDLVSLPKLNKYLLDSSKELHDASLDSWTVPTGVSLIEIAGWGEDTLSGIEYYQGIKTECTNPNIFSTCSISSKTPVLEYKPKITYDGDGTVIVPSALWTMSSTQVKKYWVDLHDYNANHRLSAPLGRQHADILEVPYLFDFIQNIITQSTSTLIDYISTSTPPNLDQDKRLHFILHSPLSIDVYDDQGNHTGISTTTNQLEENIPNSRYITFGEVKYISVPASSTVYLSMQGYSSGSFTLNIEERQGNIVTASTTFAGVPSSTSTIVTINIPNGNISSTSPLIVDINGDGLQDIKLSPKIDDIVVPDFAKKQISLVRRRDVPRVATLGELITDDSIIATGTIALVEEKVAVLSPTNNQLSFSIINSPILNKKIEKQNTQNRDLSLNINKITKKGESQVLTKNSTTTESSNNNQSSVASVGTILLGNNVAHQIISIIISFIKNIINKIFL